MTIPNHRAQADELLADAEHMAASVPPHPSADGTAIFACARYLAAIHDTLLATSGSKPAPADFARVGIEPTPADDLPGEPVEPGDLRAGDRVAFTWRGERITCNLAISPSGMTLFSDVPGADGYAPNVTYRGDVWAGGISDVRLIERAPREDEEPDEALAKAICESLDFPPTSLLGCAVHAAVSDVLAARKHIEAEQEEVVATLREEVDIQTARAERAEVERAEFNGFWKEALADVRKARSERDALRERLDALRADLSPGGLIWPVDAALRRDDERAAKGEQR